jgi:hypothetical protein
MLDLKRGVGLGSGLLSSTSLDTGTDLSSIIDLSALTTAQVSLLTKLSSIISLSSALQVTSQDLLSSCTGVNDPLYICLTADATSSTQLLAGITSKTSAPASAEDCLGSLDSVTGLSAQLAASLRLCTTIGSGLSLGTSTSALLSSYISYATDLHLAVEAATGMLGDCGCGSEDWLILGLGAILGDKTLVSRTDGGFRHAAHSPKSRRGRGRRGHGPRHRQRSVSMRSPHPLFSGLGSALGLGTVLGENTDIDTSVSALLNLTSNILDLKGDVATSLQTVVDVVSGLDLCVSASATADLSTCVSNTASLLTILSFGAEAGLECLSSVEASVNALLNVCTSVSTSLSVTLDTTLGLTTSASASMSASLGAIVSSSQSILSTSTQALGILGQCGCESNDGLLGGLKVLSSVNTGIASSLDLGTLVKGLVLKKRDTCDSTASVGVGATVSASASVDIGVGAGATVAATVGVDVPVSASVDVSVTVDAGLGVSGTATADVSATLVVGTGAGGSSPATLSEAAAAPTIPFSAPASAPTSYDDCEEDSYTVQDYPTSIDDISAAVPTSTSGGDDGDDGVGAGVSVGVGASSSGSASSNSDSGSGSSTTSSSGSQSCSCEKKGKSWIILGVDTGISIDGILIALGLKDKVTGKVYGKRDAECNGTEILASRSVATDAAVDANLDAMIDSFVDYCTTVIGVQGNLSIYIQSLNAALGIDGNAESNVGVIGGLVSGLGLGLGSTTGLSLSGDTVACLNSVLNLTTSIYTAVLDTPSCLDSLSSLSADLDSSINRCLALDLSTSASADLDLGLGSILGGDNTANNSDVDVSAVLKAILSLNTDLSTTVGAASDVLNGCGCGDNVLLLNAMAKLKVLSTSQVSARQVLSLVLGTRSH